MDLSDFFFMRAKRLRQWRANGVEDLHRPALLRLCSSGRLDPSQVAAALGVGQLLFLLLRLLGFVDVLESRESRFVAVFCISLAHATTKKTKTTKKKKTKKIEEKTATKKFAGREAIHDNV